MLHIKRRFGKGATIAAASAALIAGTAGIAAAGASGPNITRATTIRLMIRGGTSAFVNVRHQRHPAVGDEVILSQPVFSAAHPAQRVGHGWVTVTLVGGCQPRTTPRWSSVRARWTRPGSRRPTRSGSR